MHCTVAEFLKPIETVSPIVVVPIGFDKLFWVYFLLVGCLASTKHLKRDKFHYLINNFLPCNPEMVAAL